MIHLLLALSILIGTSLADATELHVSAPRSLKGALLEISELHEKNHPAFKVKLRTGKSSELGRMIAGNHRTDVFILADQKTVEQLKSKNKADNVRKFLADDLVVIAAAASTLVIDDPKKLSFPELKGVALFAEKHPVGKVARAYLTGLNLSEALAPKISPKKSTKEVVTGIVAGEADWGIVYASDVVHSKGVKVIWKIPETAATPEIYFSGTVADSPHKQAARQYLATLNSTIARKIFQNAGFRLLVPAEP
jgi:molybdate transport system substrate-binding protein